MNVIVIAHKGQQALAKSLADGDAVLVTFSSLFIVPVNLSSLTQCFLLPDATVIPRDLGIVACQACT